MKFFSTATPFLVVLSSLVAVVVVFGEEGVDMGATTNNDATAIAAAVNDEIHDRDLQASCESTAAWHPDYSVGWDQGKCDFTTTCNSPSYSTNLACCKGAYGGQIWNYCVSQMVNPPTMSPTKTGGLDAYYPNYDVAWPEGYCANTVPMPSSRPVYTTMLGCCKGAYGGQTSGACIAKLPSPPTMAPTKTGAAGTDYYPNYDLPWPEGICINTQPIPSGRPVYTTQLACCKAAYGGQTSGACIKGLASPPTMAPTMKGGPEDAYYPDYTLAWTEGKCINTVPMPSGRPVYTTQLACCKSAYAGQSSGACIKGMANPPTFAPSHAPTRASTRASTRAPTSTPSHAPTQAPSRAPTRAPTSTPTPKPTKNCFPDKAALQTAVDTYITDGCGNAANSGSSSCMSLASNWGSPIGNWCTSLVTDMSGLFYQKSTFNEDISGWDVSKVTNMAGMFAETTFNQDISGWNVASVTVIHGMFYGASAFNQDISGWNVGLVTSMESMFKSASAFNQDISGWNVGSVTSMSLMFESASAFNHDISGWNVGSVIDMQSMFAWASAFNQDISGWDVTSVTNMDMMFESASAFNQNMCLWKNMIPFVPNYNIFASSGCTYTATPVTADDPFCAVSTCSI